MAAAGRADRNDYAVALYNVTDAQEYREKGGGERDIKLPPKNQETRG